MNPEQLAGRWHLERRLIDRRCNGYGRVRGQLLISADCDGFRWKETGQLQWAGGVFTVNRTLLFRRQADGWWLQFDDGRPFHPWRPGQLVIHECAADTYRGILDLQARGSATPALGSLQLRTLWDVTGPTKSQRILTRLSMIDK